MTHFAVLLNYGDDFKVIFTGGFQLCVIMVKSNYQHLLCIFFCLQFVKQVTKTDEIVLKILTYVGLALSITGIILTIIPYLLLT